MRLCRNREQEPTSLPSPMIKVSCGPRFQLLTSVISPSPWQHKVNNKNTSNPGKAQQGMSVLKENKRLTCTDIPARGPMWNLTVDREENNSEWTLQYQREQTRDVRLLEVLSAFKRRPEGNIASYIFMGLYSTYFTFCTNVFWIISLLGYTIVKGNRRL